VWQLRSLQFRKKLAAEKRWETHISRNEEREKLFEDYVERETAVARMRVQDTEKAMMQEQELMGNVEKGRYTTIKHGISFEEMLNAVGDSLSDLANSENEEEGGDQDDDEEDIGHGKLSKDAEPGFVMGTISKTVQHCMGSFWEKQVILDEPKQQGR
jgi:hypothetical protein